MFRQIIFASGKIADERTHQTRAGIISEHIGNGTFPVILNQFVFPAVQQVIQNFPLFFLKSRAVLFECTLFRQKMPDGIQCSENRTIPDESFEIHRSVCTDSDFQSIVVTFFLKRFIMLREP